MAELTLLEGVSATSASEWNGLVGEASPFLEWEWLASLERSGALGDTLGWLPRPLVAREAGRLVAACPLYVKGHSEGEFVFDFAWADAAHRAGLRYYPKLLVGVPFTPVGGPRILTAPDQDREVWIGRFAAGLRRLCLASEFSGVHVNFCLAEEAAALEEVGFLPRVSFQYHWANQGYVTFGDFLERLRSKRRNQIQRERRAIAEQGIRVEARVGAEIPEAWFAAMFRFYRDTVDKYPWGRPYLNQDFFALLRERFAHRLCLVVARQGERLLGGALNVQKGEALYGRYWGASSEVRHLHFEVCYYAGIDHCIRLGLQRFEPGAGGDYKQLRGFDAQPTWSAHFLAEPRLAAAVASSLEAERAEARHALGWLRERSALKPRKS
jgi:predicted N-acyltransferase